MEGLTTSELLFYGGISLAGFAALAAVIAAVTLCVSGKRLRARMEREYGKKRH